MGLKILTTFLAPGEVTASVADTGTGLDDGSLEHIFSVIEAHGGRLGKAKTEPFGATCGFSLLAMETC
jgi:hypothetical protein